MTQKTCDLFIVGGGPAGLSAAITAASEGLATCLADSNQLGGQAGLSSMIRNYPGFPEGVSGSDLAANLIEQAQRFKVEIIAPATAVALRPEGGRVTTVLEDFSEYYAKAVILSPGLYWRRLVARGIGGLLGHGVYYGNPPVTSFGAQNVGIVGGANSAGQAAVHAARNPDTRVKLFVRSTIRERMSHYLIEEIKERPNIEVIEGVETIEAHGRQRLERVTLANTRNRAQTREVGLDFLLIFIGAEPRTHWLKGNGVKLNERGFILSDGSLTREDWPLTTRRPLPYETSTPGVFVAGDVRAECHAKRIATAVGEGAAAVAAIHQYLKTMEGLK
jgi:thioredoxin reductase (NADPH)